MGDNEFAPRRAAVALGLAERKLDALLVGFGPNVRYLTGFTGDNGNLLVMAGRSILFTDPRFDIQARQEVGVRRCGWRRVRWCWTWRRRFRGWE